MNKVVILGGGASGLMAAIVASMNGAKVTILEHKDRVGKKILMTGNGKCNLTNLSDYQDKYFSENLEFVHDVLQQFSGIDTCEFFKNMGLYTKEKRDGGIYPVSEQAASVLDVLRLFCDKYNVQVKLQAEVKEINFKGKEISYISDGNKEKIFFDKLIIATGGKSASVSGSDGSGYAFAKQLGLKIIKPLPALVQLKCDGNYFKLVNGVRTEALLSLYINDEYICSEQGELQLTDYGISGIPVFQISRHISRALDMKMNVYVRVNFLPYLSKENIRDLKNDKEKYSFKTLEEYLNGLVNKKLSVMFCKQAGYDLNTKLSNLSPKEFNNIISLIRNFEIKIRETNGFEQAQVTCGGISLTEVDENLSCKKNHDIYFTGEILDCDGICGGYNLQWAWATGYIAGKHAASGKGNS